MTLSVSPITPEQKSNKNVKIAAAATGGAIVGGVASYAFQKRTLVKHAEEEAAKNAPKTIVQKIVGFVKGAKDKVVKFVKDSAAKVIENGKISKMGIAKAAVGAALVAGAAVALMPSNKANKAEKEE